MLPIPECVRSFGEEDVAAQRIPWTQKGWLPRFAPYSPLFERITAHTASAGGIARQFVHDLANGDPVELFLGTMAWGWGNDGRGPARVASILRQPKAAEELAQIVNRVRTNGPADGWTALLADHHIMGLGMAFGTKLLYFAAYTTNIRPRPLILDARVRNALQTLAPGTVPPTGKTVWRDDYIAYLELAASWANDSSWNQSPDVVEYGLFQHEDSRQPDPSAIKGDRDANGRPRSPKPEENPTFKCRSST